MTGKSALSTTSAGTRLRKVVLLFWRRRRRSKDKQERVEMTAVTYYDRHVHALRRGGKKVRVKNKKVCVWRGGGYLGA